MTARHDVDPPVQNSATEVWQLRRQLDLLMAEGQYALAVASGERWLDLREDAPSATPLDVIEVLFPVAQAYMLLNLPERAGVLLGRALNLVEGEPAHSLVDVMVALMARAGTMLLEAGDEPAAQALQERAAATIERWRGPECLELGRVLDLLGQTRFTRKQWAPARSALARALQIYERTYAPDHAGLVPVIQKLADADAELGEHDRAEAGYERMRAILEKHFPPGDLNRAVAPLLLGDLYMRREKPGRAVVFYDEALATAEEACGAESSHLVRVLEKLGKAAFASGALGKAKKVWTRGLRILEAQVGKDEPSLLPFVEGLRDVATAREDFKRAVRLSERCVRLLEEDLRRAEAHLATFRESA